MWRFSTISILSTGAAIIYFIAARRVFGKEWLGHHRETEFGAKSINVMNDDPGERGPIDAGANLFIGAASFTVSGLYWRGARTTSAFTCDKTSLKSVVK